MLIRFLLKYRTGTIWGIWVFLLILWGNHDGDSMEQNELVLQKD